MTPQPHPSPSRVLVRRSAALLAAVLVIGGTPLVARALDTDVVAATERPAEIVLTPPTVAPIGPLSADRAERAASDTDPDTDVGVDTDDERLPETTPEVVVDPVIALLADGYAWDERGPRIVALQEALGIAADGWYGHATLRAHRGALDFVGLATTLAPDPVLPPGPEPSKWAALRQCESNGNYAITNPSGKYRGAYQFDRSTWNSVAERHAPQLVGVDPAAASPADQDAMAFALYSERGARPWPHCGRHLA